MGKIMNWHKMVVVKNKRSKGVGKMCFGRLQNFALDNDADFVVAVGVPSYAESYHKKIGLKKIITTKKTELVRGITFNWRTGVKNERRGLLKNIKEVMKLVTGQHNEPRYYFVWYDKKTGFSVAKSQVSFEEVQNG